MATYHEITKWVKTTKGYTPKPCWIAHVKELCGLPLRTSPNRENPNIRKHPCPEHKIEDIKQAFRHYKML